MTPEDRAWRQRHELRRLKYCWPEKPSTGVQLSGSGTGQGIIGVQAVRPRLRLLVTTIRMLRALSTAKLCADLPHVATEIPDMLSTAHGALAMDGPEAFGEQLESLIQARKL